MASTTGIRKDLPSTSDRRGCPRESLPWVVLVFFGENNWGKLIDLSESGMSFEFAQAPPMHERIHFRFETMGIVKDGLGRGLLSDSFEASGKVVWSREFERAAGVQFLDLSDRSREQLRNMLWVETRGRAGTLHEAAESEVLVQLGEPYEPPARLTDVPPEGEVVEEGTWPDIEVAESKAAANQETGSEPALKTLQAPTYQAYGEPFDTQGQSQNLSDTKPGVSRTTLLAVLGCLVVVSAVAVAMKNSTLWTRRAEVVPRALSSPVNNGQASNAAVLGPQRFVVEVSDIKNKRWLLWFAHNDAKNTAKTAAYRSSASPSPFEPAKKATGQEHPSTTEKTSEPPESMPFQPTISRPVINSVAVHASSDGALEIPDVEATPPVDSNNRLVTNGAVPVPIERSTVVGGQVQQARLLKYVAPTYPEIAKANHVGGDVTLDALVDASGNVTKVHALTGPPLLRQAAEDALHQWKYEPAQLDGQPVAMHLTVTVKFQYK